jgi:hypothetical protein
MELVRGERGDATLNLIFAFSLRGDIEGSPELLLLLLLLLLVFVLALLLCNPLASEFAWLVALLLASSLCMLTGDSGGVWRGDELRELSRLEGREWTAIRSRGAMSGTCMIGCCNGCVGFGGDFGELAPE